MKIAEISVREQCAGKNVLITGTTGFIGKVLLEKIIRDVPEVESIVLLIRGNNQHPTARERFDNEVATASIFNRLREEDPAGFRRFCHEKIECVTGEVSEKHFGMGEENFRRLASRLDCVIHSAASVNFREELDVALSINTIAVFNIAELVKAAGDIPLIHVSTCYVNGFNEGACLEEVVSPAKKAMRRNQAGFYEVKPLIAQLKRKAEKVRESALPEAKMAARLVDLGEKESHRHGWNDVYTFTKWLAEQVVMEELQGSTVTILRPSVVESTIQEPVRGWLEGVKVADAVTLAYARQKTTFFPMRTEGIVDIIPADLVANSIILATAEAFSSPSRIARIYQCCSGGTNPMKFGTMVRIQTEEMQNNFARYERLLPKGKPRQKFRPINQGLFRLGMGCLKTVVLSHAGVCNFMGVENRMKGLTTYVETTMKLAVTFSFYAAPKYRFYNHKLMDLLSRVTHEDRERFTVDARIIDWEHYIGPMHLAGLNRYVLKDRSKKPVVQKVEEFVPLKGEVGLEPV